jgi:hypothetical protein
VGVPWRCIAYVWGGGGVLLAAQTGCFKVKIYSSVSKQVACGVS